MGDILSEEGLYLAEKLVQHNRLFQDRVSHSFQAASVVDAP